MKLPISTLVGFTLLVAGACMLTSSDQSAGLPIPYQVLGESSLGNAQLGAPVYAATSMSQLASLIAAHRPGMPAPQGCCPGVMSVATPSLLLAFQKPGGTVCTLDSFSDLRLAGDAVTIEIRSEPTFCTLFAQPASSPVLLLAVPLAELPTAVIEVRIQGAGDAEQRSHFPREWSTVVDLRQPLADRSVAPGDIQAGVEAAWNADLLGPSMLGEVAVRRWTALDPRCGLQTGKAAALDDVVGVVIRVVYEPNDSHIPWIAKQHEYTWRIGSVSFLDDCGEVS
jgi:hypothetical protein